MGNEIQVLFYAFGPTPVIFDSVKFSVTRLRHVLRAKAVLCSGLTISFYDENTNESEEWYYEDGLRDYLVNSLQGWELLPASPFVGNFASENEAVDWAVQWLPEAAN